MRRLTPFQYLTTTDHVNMDRLIAQYTVPVGSGDTAPATGTPGQATSGNPATNTPATRLPAYAWNAIQEELMAVLTAASIVADRTNNAQVAAAIRRLVQTKSVLADTGAANAYAASNAPALTALPSNGFAQVVSIANTNTGAATYAPDGLAAKPILGMGLAALQGGELPAKGIATLLYVVASNVNSGNGAWLLIECTGGAQQLGAGSYGVTPATGNRSTSLATTAMFANEFGVLLSGNGYQKLPSGLIVQWFSYGGVGTAGATFNYPIAFPNGRLGIALAHQQIKGGATVIVSASVGTNSQVDITASASGTSGYAIAVGY